jgi:hypothetical protein
MKEAKEGPTVKHTPGPWTLNIGCGSKGYAGNYEIMEALTEEHAANAKLIAAAPKLLAALEEVMTWIKNWDPNFTEDREWSSTEASVRAAIAEAKGEA